MLNDTTSGNTESGGLDTGQVSMDEKNVGGNYYDKHNSKNPAVRFLMRNFYRTFVDSVSRERFSSMLDIGCGEGHLTNILHSHFRKEGKDVKITALEYDQKTVMLANALYPFLNVKQGDILSIKGKYDLLVSSEVLEHVRDYEKAINNCKNASETCIFSVPNEPWLRIANICRLKYLNRLGSPPGHVNSWSKKSFRRLLKKHFKNVEIKTTGLWNVAVCKQPINGPRNPDEQPSETGRGPNSA